MVRINSINWKFHSRPCYVIYSCKDAWWIDLPDFNRRGHPCWLEHHYQMWTFTKNDSFHTKSPISSLFYFKIYSKTLSSLKIRQITAGHNTSLFRLLAFHVKNLLVDIESWRSVFEHFLAVCLHPWAGNSDWRGWLEWSKEWQNRRQNIPAQLQRPRWGFARVFSALTAITAGRYSQTVGRRPPESVSCSTTEWKNYSEAELLHADFFHFYATKVNSRLKIGLGSPVARLSSPTGLSQCRLRGFERTATFYSKKNWAFPLFSKKFWNAQQFFFRLFLRPTTWN